MPRPSHLPALLDLLAENDGVATCQQIVAATSLGTLRAAVADRHVVRLGHGTYARPGFAPPFAPAPAWSVSDDPDEHRRCVESEALELHRQRAWAQAHAAALSHRSAARQHGWAVLVEPERLDVVVPLERRRRPAPSLRVRRRPVTAGELSAGVTSPVTTVLHCAADLPFIEGLAVADSALRWGTVGPATLRDAADTFTGRGRARARLVAAHADGRADNPFESGLRALSLRVPDATFVPQYVIRDQSFYARVDLADPHLRIVAEADGYRFHGGRESFARDVRRYDELAARGWIVLRFTLRHVLHEPDWVVDTLLGAVRSRG